MLELDEAEESHIASRDAFDLLEAKTLSDNADLDEERGTLTTDIESREQEKEAQHSLAVSGSPFPLAGLLWLRRSKGTNANHRCDGRGRRPIFAGVCASSRLFNLSVSDDHRCQSNTLWRSRTSITTG